jgi:hypothetical protein
MEILRTLSKARLLALSAAVLGIFSTFSTFSTPFLESRPSFLGLWGIMPLLCMEAESRYSAFLAAFAFYLSISRDVVPGSYVFFRDGSLIRSLTLWLLSGAALALPWC